MKTIYYKMLSDVVTYLENKYNVNMGFQPIDHIAYETKTTYNGGHFIAKIYRMPSGNYEVVDYAIKLSGANK